MRAAVVGFINDVVFIGDLEISQHQKNKQDGHDDILHYFLKLLMVLMRPSSAERGSLSIPRADFIFALETSRFEVSFPIFSSTRSKPTAEKTLVMLFIRPAGIFSERGLLCSVLYIKSTSDAVEIGSSSPTLNVEDDKSGF